VCWRDLFLSVLTQGHPAEAIGAFGLGTEHIVKSMYQYVIEALKFVPDLDPKDTCFFVLHTSVDEHHNAALHRIACEFAYTEEGRVALRRGMLKVLNLRSVFWDAMLARALKLDTNPCY
jgi:pyrroloquinoline quinone (PQQ) biosynthesis protein C